MKTLVLSFDPTSFNAFDLIRMLKKDFGISDFAAPYPGLVVIRCEFSASKLSKQIENSPYGGQFFIAEVYRETADGLLPKSLWDWLPSQLQRQAVSKSLPPEENRLQEHS